MEHGSFIVTGQVGILFSETRIVRYPVLIIKISFSVKSSS